MLVVIMGRGYEELQNEIDEETFFFLPKRSITQFLTLALSDSHR